MSGTTYDLTAGRVKLSLDAERGGALAGLWYDRNGDGAFGPEDLLVDTGPGQGLVLEVVETSEGAQTTAASEWVAGRKPEPRESWFPGRPYRLAAVTDSVEQPALNRIVVQGRFFWAGIWPYRLEWELAESGLVRAQFALLEAITLSRSSEVLALGMDLRYHYAGREAFHRRAVQAGVDARVWELPAEVIHRWKGLEGYLSSRERYGFSRESEIPWPEFELATLAQQGPQDCVLWKATGPESGPLPHWRGARARGWMHVGDGARGLGYGIPDMPAAAAASLAADLNIGDHRAAVRLRWWPRETRRACLRGADWEHLRGPHALFLLPHAGGWSRALAEQLDAVALPESGIPPVEPEAARVRFQVPAEAPEPAPEGVRFRIDEPAGVERTQWPVTAGVPLRRGEVQRGEALVLSDAAGRTRPVQTEPLAFWPDGSVKWVLLDAQVDLPRSAGASFALARGEQAPAPAQTVRAVETPRGVRVETGPLVFEVDREGSGCIDRAWLEVNGRPEQVVGEGGTRRSRLDFIRTDTYRAGEHDLRGTRDASQVEIRELRVERDGPLRAVVLLRGVYRNRRESEFTLRLEAYAGKPWIRAQHTWTYTLDPDGEFLHAAGLRLPLQCAERPQVMVAGLKGQSDTDPPRLGLLQESLNRALVWAQREDGLTEETEVGGRSAGWVDVSTQSWGVTVAVQEFWQEFAKGLEVDRESGEVTAWFWPPQAPPLDLRRYSPWTYAQVGETISPWPYRGDARPVGTATGLAKTSTAVFAFHAGPVTAEEAEGLARGFQDRPLAICHPRYYEEVRIGGLFAGYDPAYPRLEQTLTDICDWFIFNRQRFSWYGLVDYGDIGHTWRPALARDDGSFEFRDGWCYDIGRWGWTNTEGQDGLAYFLSFFHTGQRAYLDAGAATARHNQDIDIFQCGPHQYMGHTRHNVNHWGDGDFEIRISQPSPNRFYYYLTGDPRSRDVITGVVDDLYTHYRVSSSADLGAVLYGFLVRWEMTGETVWRERTLGLAHAYGDCIYPTGYLPSHGFRIDPATGELLSRETRPASEHDMMFLHGFGAIHALIELERLTEDARLREVLSRHAAYCAGLEPSVNAYLLILSHALALTGEERFAARLRANIVKRRLLTGLYPRDRKHWTGVWSKEEAPEVRTVGTSGVGFDWSPMLLVLHALKAAGIGEEEIEG